MSYFFKSACLYFVFQLFINLSAIGQTTASDSLAWDKQIDVLVTEVMSDWSIPGLAITVVENNAVILEKGYGVSNIDTRTPVDPETTVFHVASISKPVTAMAILQLNDAGQLNLDDSINELLPDLKMKNSFNEHPSLRDVLVHAGGFDIQNIDRMARSADELNTFEEYLSSNMPPVIYLAAAELGNQNILSYGVPVWFSTVKVLTWLSIGLVAGCLIALVLSWKKQYWDSRKRIKFSIASTIMLLFIVFLSYWNLLG